MAVISPGEWFLADREGVVFFHNLVRHYNSTSTTYEVPNPFQRMLVEVPRTGKFKIRFSNELIGIVREVATMLSSFDIADPVTVNSKGDTFPADICGRVALAFLD